MKYNKICIAIICCIVQLHSQAQRTAPAPPAAGKISLKGGSIHTGNGQVIPDGLLIMENNKIVWIGAAANLKTDETLGKVIDTRGMHIYPALIGMLTTLGLNEIEAVRASRDASETGDLNPNVRASVAYNTDSKVSPTVRSNGVLYAQIAPEGGRMPGQSAVMQLDAWNWEDALVKEGEGLFLYWPERFRYRGWWAEPGGYEANKDYEQQVREIESLFNDAKSYMFEHNVFNARLDAMRGLWNSQSRFYIYADEAESILQAIALAERFGLKPVICGARDSWQIADILASKKIAVVLQRVHALPASEDESVEQPYRTAAILKKAGVEVALGCPGEFWQVRNLPFYAGSCAGYGLNAEEALSLVTLAPARILGLDKMLGSLEAGKEASIVVSSGDLLDMRSSKVKHAFIGGREIDLNNKQTELYQLYLNKYNLKE